ncbi:MAG: hypothetical protein QXE81_00810 [Desulfurococcaceae archaeon]
MKWVVITSFTEHGYSKLAEFLVKQDVKIFIPIPDEVCKNQDVRYIPSSFYRVWRPVLDIIFSYGLDVECYRTFQDITNQVDIGLKVAILVLKAKAYGKVNESEWLGIIPLRLKPVISQWSGILVVDDYIEYLLLKRIIFPDKITLLDLLLPTPLDLLAGVKSSLFTWKCRLSEIIKWCIEYIGEYVVRSIDLTDAYRKLLNNTSYLDFLRECIGNEV